MSSHFFSALPALQQRRPRGPVRFPGAAVFRDEEGLQRDDASAAPFAHSHIRQRQLPGPERSADSMRQLCLQPLETERFTHS